MIGPTGPFPVIKDFVLRGFEYLFSRNTIYSTKLLREEDKKEPCQCEEIGYNIDVQRERKMSAELDQEQEEVSYFQSHFKSSIQKEDCTFFGRKGKILFLRKDEDPNLIELWEAHQVRFTRLGDPNFDFGPIVKPEKDWPQDGYIVTYQSTTFRCRYENISIEEAQKMLAE